MNKLLVATMIAMMGFSYYFISELDKKVKIQAKEIQRQQLVIALQQTEIDSYKIKSQYKQEAEKLVKDLL